MAIIARLLDTNHIDSTLASFRPDAKLETREIGYTLLPEGLTGGDLGNIMQVNDQTMVVANWYWVTHTVPTLVNDEDAPPVVVRTPHLEVWLIDVGEAQKRQRAQMLAQARAQAGGRREIVLPPGVGMNGR